nr:hypothetical protein Iba_chr07aCG11240 [Ipomoea batatas]
MTSKNNCIIEDVDNACVEMSSDEIGVKKYNNFCDEPYDDSFDHNCGDAYIENVVDNLHANPLENVGDINAKRDDDICDNSSNACKNATYDSIESCEDNFSNSYDSNSSNPCANHFFVSFDDNEDNVSTLFDNDKIVECNEFELLDLVDNNVLIDSVDNVNACVEYAVSKDRSEGVEIESRKEEVEDKKKTRDESVREEVEEKMPPRTRNKEMAKKRRHDESGTSSEGQSDLVAPGGRGLGHLNAIQLARVEELQTKMDHWWHRGKIHGEKAQHWCLHVPNIEGHKAPLGLNIRRAQEEPAQNLPFESIPVVEHGGKRANTNGLHGQAMVADPGYIRRVDDNPDQAEDEPQPPAPGVGEGQEAPQGYNIPPQYPEVHDWASMRALQIHLYTDTMNTFNRQMDYIDGVLERQKERSNRQSEAIEKLRLWMENRFPPPSQGGDGSY